MDGAEGTGSIDCPEADGLGASLVNNICWDCIFPIRIAGADISLGDSFVPARAARTPVCRLRQLRRLYGRHVGARAHGRTGEKTFVLANLERR